jgi:2-amino-4-hydroxy-6-hydroxymethyldihydropteridine diphosphokinase
MNPPPVFLGLGSNLGDRESAIAGALERLAARGFRTTLSSSLWLTEPVGGPPQGPFLNAVAGGETERGPEALLLVVQQRLDGRDVDQPRSGRRGLHQGRDGRKD